MKKLNLTNGLGVGRYQMWNKIDMPTHIYLSIHLNDILCRLPEAINEKIIY